MANRNKATGDTPTSQREPCVSTMYVRPTMVAKENTVQDCNLDEVSR